MRLLISILVVVALLIGAGCGVNHQLTVSSDKIIQQMDTVNRHIKQGNWPLAVEQTAKLEDDWDRETKWWPIFFEHCEIDGIEFSLAKFKEYVASESTPLSLGQLAEMKIMLEHIPKKEGVSWHNIF